MKLWISKTCRENRSFLLFLLLMFVFRSSFADWNSVPTGSMKPTILEGDRILVNKLAYDFHLPFTSLSLIELGHPKRGDIIVFDSNTSQIRLVKRVVGVPGDTVEMYNNVLRINGEELKYQKLASGLLSDDRLENLLGQAHAIRVQRNGSRLSNFAPVLVPSGHYLALGDNRDNSADSRVIGLIPRDEIIGRSRSVVMSLNYDNYFIPRGDRFFHAL